MSGSLIKKIYDKKASLLIEVLLAVMILSVSITVIIQSMTSSARAMGYSSDYAAAAALVENKMQEYILAGAAPSGDEEGTFDDFGGKYQYSVKVSGTEDDASKIKVVEVAVLWNTGAKKDSFRLQSYFLNEE